MAKKETPVMSFTKAEANYIKKIAGIKIVKPEKITNKGWAKKEKTIEDYMELIKQEEEIRKIEEAAKKADKGRKLLEQNPDFIFGKEGKKYIGMIYELLINLTISNNNKKTKIKTSILEKLNARLDQLPMDTELRARVYFE